MKRKDEHLAFKRNLRVLTEDVSDIEKEQAKSKLFELFRKDAPLVLAIIHNGYFFDKEAKKVCNDRLIDIVNGNLQGYSIPDYYDTMKFIKERKY
jgi:hypothetical protein